jgi:hypothetical protein
MRRLVVHHANEWKSTEDVKLFFQEFPDIERELVGVTPSQGVFGPSVEYHYKNVDKTPSNCGSWIVWALNKGGGKAGIEAYQQLNQTIVDFWDGYMPLHPTLKFTPIGAAFEEFCDMVVRETHAASDEAAKLQADSDMVAEQPTPAEDEAGKKHGPIDTKLDALLAGQTAIREDLSGLRLDQGQLATVQAVLDAIEAGLVPIGELEETLVAVQHTLSEIQQQGVALPDSILTSEEFEHLSEVVDAPKLDVKHKLKVTVPIIPYFLSYEGEVELKSGLDLEGAWKRLVGRVRDT